MTTTGGEGMGAAPCGVAAYGIGMPTETPTPGGEVYQDAKGTLSGSAEISLKQGTVGQYVYDSYGRKRGMPDVNQLVLLAAKTVRGESAAQDLGVPAETNGKVTANFVEEQTARITSAFQSLIDAGYIRIDGVEVKPNSGMPAQTYVHITELVTGAELVVPV